MMVAVENTKMARVVVFLFSNSDYLSIWKTALRPIIHSFVLHFGINILKILLYFWVSDLSTSITFTNVMINSNN